MVAIMRALSVKVATGGLLSRIIRKIIKLKLASNAKKKAHFLFKM